jgi:tetratricopeptide (TPR) repeat protein
MAKAFKTIRGIVAGFKEENAVQTRELYEKHIKQIAKKGVAIEYLNKWNFQANDAKNLNDLASVIDRLRLGKVELESYHQFFIGKDSFYQELKKLGDAYLMTIGKLQTNNKNPLNPAIPENQSRTLSGEKEICCFVRNFFSRYKITEISVVKRERNILKLKIRTPDPGLLIGRAGENIRQIEQPLLDRFQDYSKVITMVEHSNPVKAMEFKNSKFKNPESYAIKMHTPTPRKDAVRKMKTATSQIKDFTDFSKNASDITIYIDEGWPGLVKDNTHRKNEGIIGGIVWLGKNVDEKLLPVISTHLREIKSTSVMAEGLLKLLECQQAMPFIMPIDNTILNVNAQKSYFELFEAAIKILLGWLLPQSGTQCNVRIFAEHIAEFVDNTDKTDYFQGLLRQASEYTRHRFVRFHIETVKWKGKEFEYIPYADLLSYLPQEAGCFGKNIGKAANYKTYYGYVPLSLDLFNLVSRLDIVEDTKNVEDFYKLIDLLHGTKIYSLIMNDLAERLENQQEIKLLILGSLEEKYRQKERDLTKLRKYFKELYGFIQFFEDNAAYNICLQIVLLKIQKANHDGCPEAANFCAERYEILRGIAIEQGDLDMAIECDLNLGVHFNDRFLFDEALRVHQQNFDAPYFQFLRPIYKAKIVSSLGQCYSIARDYQKAESYFEKAIRFFENCEHPDKSRDIEQTIVYRLINALEGEMEGFEALFSSFFNLTEDTAIEFAKSDSVLDQYKHHLFIRVLCECPRFLKYKESYLENEGSWKFQPFHPWQLIVFYRALLVYEGSPKEAYDYFSQALEICNDSEHGDTMAVIGAVLGVVGTQFFDDESGFLKKETEGMIEKSESVVGALNIVETLRDALVNPQYYDVWSLLGLLPFNYR